MRPLLIPQIHLCILPLLNDNPERRINPLRLASRDLILIENLVLCGRWTKVKDLY